MAQPNRKPQPITRHPLFPAIVALWFAALLGMGSFVLSTSLIETLVLAGHVDSLIPAAAPPLGVTARLALALALGGMGGAAGWFLARRQAEPRPAAAPQVFKVAESDLPAPLAPAVRAPAHEAATPAFIEMPAAQPAPEPKSEPERKLTAAERIANAELEDLSHVELVERLAIAIQRRQELAAESPAGDVEPAHSVVRFPGLADRQVTRLAPPAAAARPAPHETEKALREALASLQRMSGNG